MNYQNHPAADSFPMMDKKRLSELVDDVRANGQREAITLCDGMILDGRNRALACQKLGIDPVTKHYKGDPWAYVWSMNGQRRDLSVGQRGAIKLQCDQESERWREEQSRIKQAIKDKANKKRSEAAKEQHEVSNPRAGETMVAVTKQPAPNDEHPARAARAKAAGVSPATQAQLDLLKNKRPDLLKAVAKGTVKLAEAMRQMKKDEIAKRIDPPTGKYRVIYADPPWSYGNTQPDYHKTDPRDHYPVMKLSDICALGIKDIAEDDAVLFLWVTSPLLEESFQVIKAWGFKYKASFVWDKIKHNMGHYNSVRWESPLPVIAAENINLRKEKTGRE